MSVVVEMTVDAADCGLDRLLALPETWVEFEQVVPVGRSLSPLWIHGGVPTVVDDAFEADPAVASATVVDCIDEHRLYEVDWDDRTGGFFDVLRDADLTVLEGIGLDEHWRFTLRFAGHADLDRFQSNCTDREVPIHPTRIHSTTERVADRWHGLTGEQRRALALAVREGYFRVPREITLADLADRLDVSDQAISERLRRGIETLATNTLPLETGDPRPRAVGRDDD